MKTLYLLLPAIAMAAAVGCDKPESGKGMTEPSPRHEGVEQPPKWEPERSPGTMPTQGSPSTNDSLNADDNTAAGREDGMGGRGQTNTPPSAFGDAGAMIAPSNTAR